jgi:hypothetical protein
MDELTTNSQNLLALLNDFLDIKIEHLIDEKTLSLMYEQALAYADSVDDYWPDHKVTVIFDPQLKDEI